MFKWKKLGRIFDPTKVENRTWIKQYSQAPSTLVFDDFVRVYFATRPDPDEQGNFVSYAGFVDLNRNNLFEIINIAEEPALKLGERGCFDEFGTYPISTIREGNEVWAYYGGWTRQVSIPYNTAIGFAKSCNNGVSFEKLGNGPVLSYSLDEPFNLGSMQIRKFNDVFHLFYVAGKKWIVVEGVPQMSLKIRMATSKDGLNWQKHNKNLIADSIDGNESQASPDVIFINGKYHMFFDYWDPMTFRKSRKRKIGYACSEDLINWKRDDQKAGIEVSESGWDSEMLAYPHVFELDGNIYMFYLGNEVGRYGFGLAQLEGELK